MDTAVEAALIGGAVAAGVAIVSTVTTAWTMVRTLRANREDAGDARLWEKTSAIYESILKESAHRQLVREHRLRNFRFDEESEQRIRDRLDAYQLDYLDYEARVRAYASDRVLELFLAVHAAERNVEMADAAWAAAAAAAKDDPQGREARELPTHKPRVEAARKNADEALIALGDQVRRELREGHLRERRFRPGAPEATASSKVTRQ